MVPFRSGRRAFTFIEFLFILAILGILAAIGVPQYHKYQRYHQEQFIQANHQSITRFLSAIFQNCREGAREIQLGEVVRDCDALLSQDVADYFVKVVELANPYDKSAKAVIAVETPNQHPPKGITYIYIPVIKTGNIINVISAVSAESADDLVSQIVLP